MSEHQALMASLRMSRADYLRALRKQQPMAELERKAAKARRRDRLWTQEELDLGAARAVAIITSLCVE